MATKKSRKTGKRGKAASPKSDETTLLMPPTQTVQSLANEKRRTKKKLSEIAGDLGTSVKSAVDKKHLDKTAFAIATRLDALSDDKLAVTYYHLLRYMDDLDIPNRASAQGQMFEDAKEADGEKAAGADNVTPIGQAARKVVEAVAQ